MPRCAVRLRADDIVARIGGDEFAVLLPGADLERAAATAERLVEAVEHGVEHGVTASVGVAMLDGTLTTADDALMAADLAMYDAKHEGRRRAAFYEGGAKSSTHSRLQWVDRIRTALAEERLALLAQPIVDLDSGRVHHEILLRMVGPDGELIAPGAVPADRRAVRADGRDRPLGGHARDRGDRRQPGPRPRVRGQPLRQLARARPSCWRRSARR